MSNQENDRSSDIKIRLVNFKRKDYWIEVRDNVFDITAILIERRGYLEVVIKDKKDN